MEQRIKDFCDDYMWLILPAVSSILIILSVIIEKSYPLSKMLSDMLN